MNFCQTVIYKYCKWQNPLVALPENTYYEVISSINLCAGLYMCTGWQGQKRQLMTVSWVKWVQRQADSSIHSHCWCKQWIQNPEEMRQRSEPCPDFLEFW